MDESESAPSLDAGSAPLHANGSTEGRDLHDLLRALQAMRMGDFSVRMARDVPGLLGKIADTFNEIVSTNQHIAQQLEHVGQVVGKDGRTRQRLRIGLATRSWGEMENSVNALIDDLLWPTAEVTRSIEAVAWGDLLLPFALPECATSTEIASLEHVGSRVLIVEDEALV